MTAAPPLRSEDRFDLSAGGASLVLEDGGFRLRLRPGRGRVPLTPYRDLTHIDASHRGLWIGTRNRVVFLRRGRFRGDDAPRRLADALRARVADQAGGLHQLANMAEIEHLLARAGPRRATTGLVLLCLAAYALQIRDGFITGVGAFVPELVRAGEAWRLITANFLHGFLALPAHLMLNVLGILGFAYLVERPLGPLRTLVLLAGSGIAAMGASGLASDAEVIGASGMVAGLAGAALCLELHFASRLPAWWRLPRRFYVAVLVVEGFLGFSVPAIAGAAHLGGFVAGYLLTRQLAPTALARRPAEAWVRSAAVAALVAIVLSVFAATPLARRSGPALASHGRHLLEARGALPSRYNELAWRMLTEAELDPEQLQVALELAQVAVRSTFRRDPNILDTLAEALFASGDERGALGAIDEAIALAPAERYFREQRRRFTGERRRGDRPEAPQAPWPFGEPPEDPRDDAPESGVAI